MTEWFNAMKIKKEYTMVNYFKRVLPLILLLQFNLHCQMHKDIREFRTEICHPNNKYEITPIYDCINTLEGTPAGLPYGTSSGEWGSSGKMWTAQEGTPIGFGITYYSDYENKYYEIKQDFDLEFIKEMTNRCYPTSDNEDKPTKEFITFDEYDNNFEEFRYTYDPFSTLVFGFAPKGMVVVWMRYAFLSVEVGRYQAKEITDAKKIKECEAKMLSTYRIDPETHKELIESMHVADASPQLWDNYRIKYNWDYKVTSDNKDFRFLELNNEYFNGEYEGLFQPLVLNPAMKKRAVPKVIHVFWETGKNERYIGKLFFNWEKTNEWFKNSNGNNTFQIHIDKDNGLISVKLNNQIIEPDSIRIYPNSSMRFRDSYED